MKPYKKKGRKGGCCRRHSRSRCQDGLKRQTRVSSCEGPSNKKTQPIEMFFISREKPAYNLSIAKNRFATLEHSQRLAEHAMVTKTDQTKGRKKKSRGNGWDGVVSEVTYYACIGKLSLSLLKGLKTKKTLQAKVGKRSLPASLSASADRGDRNRLMSFVAAPLSDDKGSETSRKMGKQAWRTEGKPTRSSPTIGSAQSNRLGRGWGWTDNGRRWKPSSTSARLADHRRIPRVRDRQAKDRPELARAGATAGETGPRSSLPSSPLGKERRLHVGVDEFGWTLLPATIPTPTPAIQILAAIAEQRPEQSVSAPTTLEAADSGRPARSRPPQSLEGP